MKQILFLILILSVLLTSCNSDEKLRTDAERTAQGFAVAWQQGDYDALYDYFMPELQSMRSRFYFISFFEATQELTPYNLIYDKVVLQDKDLAYVYYTYSAESAFQPKMSALEMHRIDKTWKINAFLDYFTKECLFEIEECEEVFSNEEFLKEKCLKKYSDLSISEKVELCYHSTAITFLNTYGDKKVVCDTASNYYCAVR